MVSHVDHVHLRTGIVTRVLHLPALVAEVSFDDSTPGSCMAEWATPLAPSAGMRVLVINAWTEEPAGTIVHVSNYVIGTLGPPMEGNG